jgi:cytochrome c-type biogenesis protein CcmH/NrfG
MLRTAPPEVRSWLASLGGGAPAAQPVETAGETSGEPGDWHYGDDEDVAVRRPRAAAAEPGQGMAWVVRRVAWGMGLGIVGFAIVVLVWAAGRVSDNATDSPSANPTMGTNTTDWKAEEAKLTAALADDPSDVKTLVGLGKLEFNWAQTAKTADEFNQHISKAIPYWEQASKLEPKNPEAWFGLGICYFAIDGDAKRAGEYWQKVTDLAPDSDWAKRVETHMNAHGGSSPGPDSTPK